VAAVEDAAVLCLRSGRARRADDADYTAGLNADAWQRNCDERENEQAVEPFAVVRVPFIVIERAVARIVALADVLVDEPLQPPARRDMRIGRLPTLLRYAASWRRLVVPETAVPRYARARATGTDRGREVGMRDTR
jgi:hypothetical protein